MTAGDAARVSVAVAVPPDVAFEIFTQDIDRWWRRGPKYRHSGTRTGLLHLEPHVGGRLFESIGATGREALFEIGRVHLWEPPHRLAFSWRNANFAPHETTEVLVDFAPTASGTLLTVTHRGLSTLPADHPARHGLPAAEFVRMMGLWWGDQLAALRRRCAGLTSDRGPRPCR